MSLIAKTPYLQSAIVTGTLSGILGLAWNIDRSLLGIIVSLAISIVLAFCWWKQKLNPKLLFLVPLMLFPLIVINFYCLRIELIDRNASNALRVVAGFLPLISVLLMPRIYLHSKVHNLVFRLVVLVLPLILALTSPVDFLADHYQLVHQVENQGYKCSFFSMSRSNMKYLVVYKEENLLPGLVKRVLLGVAESPKPLRPMNFSECIYTDLPNKEIKVSFPEKNYSFIWPYELICD